MPDSGNIRLSQGGETPLNNLPTPFGAIRYLYSRSADSVAQETSGQDYLAFRYDDQRVTFALCDGVSQSFMGEIAARFLGDRLVDWLWKYEGPSDPVAFGLAVQMFLNHLQPEADTLISQHSLPDDLPPLTREALEAQRAYGSEAMFVAGRTDLSPGQDRVLLCWLGDSILKPLDTGGQAVDIGPAGTTAERWSSTKGIKGRVHAWRGNTRQVTRLVAHSDGIDTETVMGALGTHGLLQQAVDRLKKHPPTDDVSLLDVNLQKEPAFRPIEVPGKPKPPVVPQVPTIPIQPVTPPAPSVEGWREIAVEGLTGVAVGMLIVWRMARPGD
jgi:hypothetical protein